MIWKRAGLCKVNSASTDFLAMETWFSAESRLLEVLTCLTRDLNLE